MHEPSRALLLQRTVLRAEGGRDVSSQLRDRLKFIERSLVFAGHHEDARIHDGLLEGATGGSHSLTLNRSQLRLKFGSGSVGLPAFFEHAPRAGGVFLFKKAAGALNRFVDAAPTFGLATRGFEQLCQ